MACGQSNKDLTRSMKIFNSDQSGSCRLDKNQADRQVDWPDRYIDFAAKTLDTRLQTFYQQPLVSADSPISRAPMLALDLETTGMDERHDAIVSIGFIAFDHQRIRCSEAANWIVQPNLPIDDIAATIHGIGHSDPIAAPSFADYFETLLQAMAGRVIVAHDSDFMKVAGNPLKVWDATEDDLAKLDIGSWFDPAYSDQRIPTLEEVLDRCRGRSRVAPARGGSSG